MPTAPRGFGTDYSTKSKEKGKIALIRRHNQEAKRKQRNVPYQSHRTVGINLNNQLPAPLTPGNGSNEEMDWEVATKRNRRKQCKDEKMNAGRTKAKPDAILIRKKDPNATFASVLKLMKDKVDKEQVVENVNKIRQTKTMDVLVQLQRCSNVTYLKEAVTTAIGSKAKVLQLSQ